MPVTTRDQPRPDASGASFRWSLSFAAVTLVVVVVMGISPFLGSTPTPWAATLHREVDPAAHDVFWNLRLPRVVTAFLAGAALALAGMTFQAIFRNALATPFTLGVSSGAALGAALCMGLSWQFSLWGVDAGSLCAFLGALGALLLVWGLSMLGRAVTGGTLLLAGVAVNYFFASLILFLQYQSDFTFSFQVIRWMMGGVEVVGFGAAKGMLPFVMVGAATIFYFARELNLLALGEDLAVARGVDAARVKALLFLATTLMVGAVVAACGPIAFVGMMAPHICRLLIGAEHRRLFLATLLFGGGFLTLCDTFARLVIAPAEIPVGIVTALLGGPFFLWLLLRRPHSIS